VPANLTPDYKAAEAAYKKARDPGERLACLREMLRTIPKHKGTERLQSELKTRIKQLSEELTAPGKAGRSRAPAHVVHPEGAGQIALVGAPNVGKSALHRRLTGSHAEVGPYPFTTTVPLPGMYAFEDVHFQIVDLPPICAEHPLPWIANTLQPADGCMLVVDVLAPDCLERVQEIRATLAAKRITLLEAPDPAAAGETGDEPDPFAIRLPTLLVATQADRSAHVEDELAAFAELLGARYPSVAVSAATGAGIERIGRFWFQALGVVRVYTKVPGRPADLHRPFTLRRGDTVQRVAELVHRELAGQLRYARLWGKGQPAGQHVGRDHVVQDGDVLELHV
jgi:hypothetical protein